MTALQLAVVILAFIVGALVGHALTLRFMVGFVDREYYRTKRHHRRLTDKP